MLLRIPDPLQFIVSESLEAIGNFFGAFWWIILPPVLFFVAFELWMLYIQTRWANAIKWVLLELKIPRDIVKTPKAMEQIFFGMFSLHQSLNLIARYWAGEFQPSASFEIFGHSGGVQFYLRLPTKFRQMAESLIYSQYPQAEITEVEDYALRYHDLPNAERDVWGTELILAKPAPYPIRTYEYYEEQKEEKRLDPLASFIEVLSRLNEGEEVWFQVIIQPPDDRGQAWIKEGQKIIDELIGKKKPAAFSIADQVFEFFINLIKAPIEAPTWSQTAEKKDEGPLTQMLFLTPGQRTAVEMIEKKISTLGFYTLIRWVYHAPKSIFTKSRISDILAPFRQYTQHDLNSLRLHSAVTPQIDYPWQFKSRREFIRKKAIFQWFQSRSPAPTRGHENLLPKNILNVAELATVYHFPITVVEAPRLHRLEFKKGAPPPTLPVE
jgi:hypothetical protein